MNQVLERELVRRLAYLGKPLKASTAFVLTGPRWVPRVVRKWPLRFVCFVGACHVRVLMFSGVSGS